MNSLSSGTQSAQPATCRVAWVRGTGLIRREIGLEFIEIEADLKQSLLAMAHTSGSASGFRLIPESERDQ